MSLKRKQKPIFLPILRAKNMFSVDEFGKFFEEKVEEMDGKFK